MHADSMMLNTLPGASAPVAPACRQLILSRQQCISQNRHCVGNSREGRRRSRLSPCISTKSAAGSFSHASAAASRCSSEAGRLDDQSTQSAAGAEDCRQQSACNDLEFSQLDTGVLRIQQPQQQLQQRQQPPWLQPPSAWQMPCAASLRTALYLVIGSLLVWRYAASRLAAGSTSFAALSLHGSFHTASQTGIAGAVRSAAAGFIAGLLHTLAGADHLAALTPLTIGRSSARASLLGALWGFGHSTGQLILGILLVVLKDRFEAFVPALTRWGGTTVGLSLIGIGGLGLLELWQDHRAEQAAASADVALAGSGSGASVSVGSSGSSVDKDAEESRGLSMGLFANGILFGLQPDALFVIIPALTLPRWAAVSYISMFVIGTVAAMGGYTAVIGATSKAIQERNPWLTTNLSVLASCTAIVIGAIVLFSL